jgi:hypothetical protein
MGATDLGYPVEHQRGLMLLFGDSWAKDTFNSQVDGDPGNESTPNDAVGQITSRTPPTRTQCTNLVINDVAGPQGRKFDPATVSGPPVNQGFFNVPSGGVGVGGDLVAFFWTNHCHAASECPESHESNSVGRSVMASSHDDGRHFHQVVPMPNGFVYATAVDATALEGLPPEQRLGIYVFAVPRYRKSTPYLAYAPPGRLQSPSSWRYFIGRKPNGAPSWTSLDVWNRGIGGRWEFHSSPELFDTDRCVGEFSITWNKPLGLWLMLYNCGEDIVARTANVPWGPWSASTVILSPDRDGVPCRLLMTDRGCGNQKRTQPPDQSVGHLYAPFVLNRYTTALSSPSPLSGPRRARIYWLVSTWDPYQVSVMRTDLEVWNPTF